VIREKCTCFAYNLRRKIKIAGNSTQFEYFMNFAFAYLWYEMPFCLFTHHHPPFRLFLRSITRPKAVSTRRSARTRSPTASHILRIKTFTTILARDTPHTHLLVPRVAHNALGRCHSLAYILSFFPSLFNATSQNN